MAKRPIKKGSDAGQNLRHVLVRVSGVSGGSEEHGCHCRVGADGKNGVPSILHAMDKIVSEDADRTVQSLDWHLLALYFMYYGFCRIHQSLRVTPAMEAGVADHVWSIEEIVALLNRNCTHYPFGTSTK